MQGVGEGVVAPDIGEGFVSGSGGSQVVSQGAVEGYRGRLGGVEVEKADGGGAKWCVGVRGGRRHFTLDS